MLGLVRFFAHAANSSPGLKQPYLARQGVESNVHRAVTTGIELTAHAATKFVRIECDGVIAVECNPPNRAVEADALSPRYVGSVTFECGPGWTFSVLEIA
jgi:hypothetical protein